MSNPLRSLLHRLVRHGTLEVLLPGGPTPERFGDGSPPLVRLRFTDRITILRLVLDPEVEIGEAFMDGRIVVEAGTIYDLLAMVLSQTGVNVPVGLPARLLAGGRRGLRVFWHYNPIGTAGSRVRRHYDLSDQLFDLFLDADRQYSCGYFTAPDVDLDTAQRAKKRHIAAKLLLRPGLRVLDIGSGWGGLGLDLARAGADVTGVTLSVGQHQTANRRARQAGLTSRLRFDLRDYRTVTDRFDRIVSVGMLEHVGSVHFRAYFDKIAALLEDDGVALVHAIGRSDGPGVTNPWITRHIFPGGYIPALSEVVAAIERSGLVISDIETLRIHYAETLRVWRERFMARRAEAVALYDERFARMWEFYLAASEASFRWAGLYVFQIQLAKRLDAVPIVRDYLVEAEREMAGAPAVQGRAAE